MHLKTTKKLFSVISEAVVLFRTFLFHLPLCGEGKFKWGHTDKWTRLRKIAANEENNVTPPVDDDITLSSDG